MSDDPLAHFPAVIALPVQWGDQDAFLHVNNTVYLRGASRPESLISTTSAYRT